ncbi:ATP synthase subunit delta [Pseudoclavibacter triregionum]|nr:ATP synthase subunit delta [Pseudoclavibacter triregionum]
MGSATKQALAELSNELGGRQGASVDAARELLDMVEQLGAAPALRTALADTDASAERKRALVDRVFAGFGADARDLLASAASRRWSGEQDLLEGLQELGLRALAQFSGQSERIATELLSVSEAVSSHGELELALSSKLQSGDAKRQLIGRLFDGKVSEPTMIALRHLLANPMGRRVRRLLARAADLVTDQAKRQVATVTTAAPLDEGQLGRLQAGLSRKFGRELQLATLVDPAVIGGIRVEFAGQVIDDTVASRLHGLRRALA